MSELFQKLRSNRLGLYGLGIALVVGWVLSYSAFIQKSRLIDYQIFNLKENISWRESKEGVYRFSSKGNIDTITVSHDKWGEFEASFNIVNPRDCGILFNYTDEQNFHFLFIDEGGVNLLLGYTLDGATHLIQKIPSVPTELLHFDLRFNKSIVSVAIQGQPIINHQFNPAHFKGDKASGGIGLMIRSARKPLTIFNEFSIDGVTVDNQKINSSNNFKGRAFLLHGFVLLILYGFIICLAIYLVKLFYRSHQLSPAIAEAQSEYSIVTVILTHLGICLFLFWPFISKGHVLISSADNFGEIFPFFYLSKHTFFNMIFNSSGLWNPYAHNGLPFFSNHWNMIYYPFNWFIFLLEDKNVLTALTMKTFVEVFLIGLCSYGFFVNELPSKRWALFCSVTYQMCSILIFTLTIFPAISLYFSMTLYVYLLWTRYKRTVLWNYILLTIAVIFVLTSANMAFVFFGGLTLVVATIYYLTTLKQSTGEWRKDTIHIAISIATGFLISAIRLFSCIFGVVESNRLAENFYTLHDRLSLITRLFIPEIVGWLGFNSFNALTSPNLNLIYEQANLPSNSQNTFLVYFGITASLLLLLNIFIKTEGKHLFWKTFTFVGLALGLMVQPFWGMFNVLLFPFNHYSYYIVILPLAVCTLLGYTGSYIENRNFSLVGIASKFFITLIFIQSLIFVIIVYLFPQFTPVARIVFLVMIVWTAVFKCLNQKNHKARNIFYCLSTLGLLAISLISIFVLSTAFFVKPLATKYFVVQSLIIPILYIFFMMFLVVWIYTAYLNIKIPAPYRNLLYAFAVSIPFIASAFIASSGFSDIINLADGYREYLFDVSFGQLKFLLITLIGVSIIALYKIQWITRGFLINLFILVTILDLSGFNARFDNVVAPTPLNKTFHSVKAPYRDLNPNVKSQLDLVNYRAHNLHKGGLSSNKNIIYKIPSYSGIMGHMPKRFSELIINFGYPKETVLIYPSESTDDERFLDLASVKYDFINPNQYNVRPTALSRMMFFTSFEITEDDSLMLSRLKDGTFDPLKRVLLKQMPLGALKQTNRPAQRLTIVSDEKNTDVYEANISTNEPGVILFNESYSKGWKAYVDGTRVPVLLANYNSMACEVPSGAKKIRFQYRPTLFVVTRLISILGVILFIGVIILLTSKRKLKT